MCLKIKVINLVIILLILVTFLIDNIWILLGENWFLKYRHISIFQANKYKGIFFKGFQTFNKPFIFSYFIWRTLNEAYVMAKSPQYTIHISSHFALPLQLLSNTKTLDVSCAFNDISLVKVDECSDTVC